MAIDKIIIAVVTKNAQTKGTASKITVNQVVPITAKPQRPPENAKTVATTNGQEPRARATTTKIDR